MNTSEYQGVDNRTMPQDIRKFKFNNAYEDIKQQIKSCKKIIKSFEEERDIYHLNIWKEKLDKAEIVLESFDFFIYLFPNIIKETGEMNKNDPK